MRDIDLLKGDVSRKKRERAVNLNSLSRLNFAMQQSPLRFGETKTDRSVLRTERRMNGEGREREEQRQKQGRGGGREGEWSYEQDGPL